MFASELFNRRCYLPRCEPAYATVASFGTASRTEREPVLRYVLTYPSAKMHRQARESQSSLCCNPRQSILLHHRHNFGQFAEHLYEHQPNQVSPHPAQQGPPQSVRRVFAPRAELDQGPPIILGGIGPGNHGQEVATNRVRHHALSLCRSDAEGEAGMKQCLGYLMQLTPAPPSAVDQRARPAFALACPAMPTGRELGRVGSRRRSPGTPART